jgi:hypothetical protein
MPRSDYANELPDPSNALAVEFHSVGLTLLSDEFRP